MAQSCSSCGSPYYEYGFHVTDRRGCPGVVCDRCLARIIGYHQNGDGDRCEDCGRVFPPGVVRHYIYEGEKKDLCQQCYHKFLSRR